MATNGKMDARQKIATLCAAMGLTHRITTAKGWSRLYVADSTGAERQIGRAWQREGEGWTLDMAARELQREAAQRVAAAIKARSAVRDAQSFVDGAAEEYERIAEQLEDARRTLTDRGRWRDTAAAERDAIEDALTDRERAILAALTEVQS